MFTTTLLPKSRPVCRNVGARISIGENRLLVNLCKLSDRSQGLPLVPAWIISRPVRGPARLNSAPSSLARSRLFCSFWNTKWRCPCGQGSRLGNVDRPTYTRSFPEHKRLLLWRSLAAPLLVSCLSRAPVYPTPVPQRAPALLRGAQRRVRH